MKIKSMTASFGRLDRATLTLDGGLNIIQGQNEGGKSTWAGFLKAMLYGIDSRDRDKKGHLADKNRYQPWSGAPMEGEITLEWGGRDITIRRSKKGNSQFAAFSAVYTGTGEPVPGMTGDNCGVMLTGVSREVFERSAFIGQNSVAVTSTPELEKRIAALVSSGQEDVSFSQAQERLKEWSNRRRVNKTVGLIPKLESELEQKRRALAHLEQVSAAITQAEGERAALEQSRRELLDEQHIHARLAQRELNQRFAQAQLAVDQAQAGVDALLKEQSRFGALPEKERLKHFQGEMQFLKVLDEEIREGEEALKGAEEAYIQANIAIQDEYFNSLTAEEARRRGADEVKAIGEKTARHNKLRKRFTLLSVLSLIPLAAGGAAMFLAEHTAIAAQWFGERFSPLWLLVGGSALCALCWVLAAAAVIQANKAKKQAAQIPARYGVTTPEEITALAEDYAQRWQHADDVAQACKQLRGGLNDRKARRENGRGDLFDFVHSFAPEVKDLFGCSAALSLALSFEDRMREAKGKLELTYRRRDDLAAQGGQLADTLEMLHPPKRSPQETAMDLAAVEESLRQIERGLNHAKGEQSAAGDPAALCARLEELTEQLERRTREHEAISIAMEALQGANVYLQERFSPDLNRLASQWLTRLTGGRYTTLSLNRELEPSATEADGLLPRKALALSKGTVDQLYLAVRLAVCQLCLPQEDPAPLVLDDALVTFDDGRMALALDCLAELGPQQQVLLFTCQEREGQYVGNQGNVLTLNN